MPQYDIAGINVDFPFEAYSAQLVYMEKVILALKAGDNALLESPTGTGKTLCLLCATLAWQRATCEDSRAAHREGSAHQQGQGSAEWVEALKGVTSAGHVRCAGGPMGNFALMGSAGGRLPRIIYSSRTHSQLQQVVRELRRTVHKPKVCVLGSREQLCVHPDVKQLAGHAQSAACQVLTASNACLFHRKLQDEKRRSGGALPHPDEGVLEADRALLDIEARSSAS